jgi:hypothetical protein
LVKPLGAGETIPQREQPFGAEAGGVQFLDRGNGNLVLSGFDGRLAGGDQVIGIDDVNAHGVGPPDPAGTMPAAPTLTLSSAPPKPLNCG